MFVALGMPSQFSVWGFEVLRRVVASAHGEIAERWIDRFDHIDAQDAAVTLVKAYFPSRTLSEACRATDSRPVLFTTTSTQAAAYQMADHGSSFTEALRTVGCSLALLQRFGGQPNILTIDQENVPTARAVVEAIAAHLRIDVRMSLSQISKAPSASRVRSPSIALRSRTSMPTPRRWSSATRLAICRMPMYPSKRCGRTAFSFQAISRTRRHPSSPRRQAPRAFFTTGPIIIWPRAPGRRA